MVTNNQVAGGIMGSGAVVSIILWVFSSYLGPSLLAQASKDAAELFDGKIQAYHTIHIEQPHRGAVTQPQFDAVMRELNLIHAALENLRANMGRPPERER